jgi:prepilin-type N-terminal cleavage/methylation domain-containing protein
MISVTGNKRETSAGFTLIEVLVASVILFAGLAAVLGAYSSAVTALDRAGDVLAATLILQQKASEVEWMAGTNPRGLSSAAGTSGSLPSLYDWKTDCRRLPTETGRGVTEVVIDVRRHLRTEPYSLVTRWTAFQSPERKETAR